MKIFSIYQEDRIRSFTSLSIRNSVLRCRLDALASIEEKPSTQAQPPSQNRSMWKAISILILFFGLLTAQFQVQAEPDFDHHRNILPGSQAGGLAGAFTAISDDPSGGFYNPAGIIYGKSNQISISVNSRQESTLKFKDIDALNGQDFVENSTTFFPSFVGSTYQLGSVKVGWSYMTLDAKNIDQSDRFENLGSSTNALKNYNRTHQESNSYFLVGASLGFKVGKEVSVGVSTYYYRREIIASNHQLVRLTNGSYLGADLKYTTENEGVIPILGIMFRPGVISFGFSIRQPITVADNTAVFSDGVIYNTANSEPQPVISSAIGTIAANAEINPMTTQIGIAWTPSPHFLISADAIQHEKKEREHITGAALDFVTTQNYSIGTKFGFSNFVLRMGAFTNNSQLKSPKEGSLNQPSHVDYVGTASSIVIKTKGIEVDLTFIEQIGRGKSQKLSDDPDIQTVTGRTRTVQVGTKYTF